MKLITDIPPRTGTFYDGETQGRLDLATQLEGAWSDYVAITRRMGHVWEASGQTAAEVEKEVGVRPSRLLCLHQPVRLQHVMAWAGHFRVLPSALLKPDADLTTASRRPPHGKPSCSRVVEYRVATQVLRRKKSLRFTTRDLGVLAGVEEGLVERLLRTPGRGQGPMPMPVLDLLCILRGLSLDLHAAVSTTIRGEPFPAEGTTRRA